MENKVTLAKDINNHISTHASNVWPDFNPLPFILYDDKSQIAVGKLWPSRYAEVEEGIWTAEGPDLLLMGNTSIMYHGRRVAIWDTRTWPSDIDTAQATSYVAHEMFHAFQHSSMSLMWANELLLPQYPHNERSVALVIEENRWLAKILTNPDAISTGNILNYMASLRNRRESEIDPDFIEYDKHCESVEGSAAYVEICMKAAIDRVSPLETAISYLPYLTINDNLLNNYRHRLYATGLLLCLASDIMWPGWQAEWAKSGKTIFDWMTNRLNPKKSHVAINTADLIEASDLLTTHQQIKEEKINKFMAQPLDIIKGNIQLISFDPMNLVCASGNCLHLHGRVKINDREQVLTMPFLAEYGDTILDIKRIFIPKTASIGR